MNTEQSKSTSSSTPLTVDPDKNNHQKSTQLNEILRTIYVQHYEHARHQELQRTGFATILGAVLAAIISQYINLPAQADLKLAVFVVGWLLSFIGYFLMYTWSRPFFRHYIFSEMIILEKWHLKDYSRIYKQEASENWTLKKIFFAISSRNFFYILTGVFTWIFGLLIGSIITDSEKYDNLISSKIDNFFPGNFEPFLFAGFTAVILLILRVWFAYEELYAVREILDRFKEIEKDKAK